MDKIFAEIKGRIIQYVEKQHIGKENFYKITGISSSNFKGKGASSEIGGDKIAKILTIYTEINPDWLILGKGDMLRDSEYKNEEVLQLLNEPLPTSLHKENELLETQRKLIQYQEEKIADLERRLLKGKRGKETGS